MTSFGNDLAPAKRWYDAYTTRHILSLGRVSFITRDSVTQNDILPKVLHDINNLPCRTSRPPAARTSCIIGEGDTLLHQRTKIVRWPTDVVS
jgi:hypothetical protein